MEADDDESDLFLSAAAAGVGVAGPSTGLLSKRSTSSARAKRPMIAVAVSASRAAPDAAGADGRGDERDAATASRASSSGRGHNPSASDRSLRGGRGDAGRGAMRGGRGGGGGGGPPAGGAASSMSRGIAYGEAGTIAPTGGVRIARPVAMVRSDDLDAGVGVGADGGRRFDSGLTYEEEIDLVAETIRVGDIGSGENGGEEEDGGEAGGEGGGKGSAAFGRQNVGIGGRGRGRGGRGGGRGGRGGGVSASGIAEEAQSAGGAGVRFTLDNDDDMLGASAEAVEPSAPEYLATGPPRWLGPLDPVTLPFVDASPAAFKARDSTLRNTEADQALARYAANKDIEDSPAGVPGQRRKATSSAAPAVAAVSLPPLAICTDPRTVIPDAVNHSVMSKLSPLNAAAAFKSLPVPEHEYSYSDPAMMGGAVVEGLDSAPWRDGELLLLNLPTHLPLFPSGVKTSESVPTGGSSAGVGPALDAADSDSDAEDDEHTGNVFRKKAAKIPEGSIGKLFVHASGKVTMELGGIEFSATIGVPRQHYQHVVATLPRSRLSRMTAKAAGLPEGEEEEEPQNVDAKMSHPSESASSAAAPIGLSENGGAAGSKPTPAPPQSFVVAGPLVHILSVSPDLESLLVRADADARAARGPILGSSIPASQHLVEQFLAMKTK